MLPTDSLYGPWPASGEIDIAEARGNNYTYQYGGNEVVSSALHWGPQPGQDGVSLPSRKNMLIRAVHMLPLF